MAGGFDDIFSNYGKTSHICFKRNAFIWFWFNSFWRKKGLLTHKGRVLCTGKKFQILCSIGHVWTVALKERIGTTYLDLLKIAFTNSQRILEPARILNIRRKFDSENGCALKGFFLKKKKKEFYFRPKVKQSYLQQYMCVLQYFSVFDQYINRTQYIRPLLYEFNSSWTITPLMQPGLLIRNKVCNMTYHGEF